MNKQTNDIQQNIFLTKGRLIFFICSFAVLLSLVIVSLISILKIDLASLFQDMGLQISKQKITIPFLLLLLFFPVIRTVQMAINYYAQCKKANFHVKFSKCISMILIYLFIISITPSSIGGEPYLIYWLRKQKMDVKQASAIVLLNSTVGHAAGMAVTWPSYIFLLTSYTEYINSSNGQLVFWFSTVGMIMDMVVLVTFAIASFSSRLHYYFSLLFNWILKILKMRHKTKDQIHFDIREKKLFRKLLYVEYKNWGIVIYIFLSSAFYQVCLYCMMTLALGNVTDINSIEFYKIFNYTNIATTANNFIPLPGSEGTLQLLLQAMFNIDSTIDSSYINESIFLWRFSSTYLINAVTIVWMIPLFYIYIKLKINKKYNNQTNKSGILIISNRAHNTIGGIELYNKILIELFQKQGIVVHELTLVQNQYVDKKKFLSDDILKIDKEELNSKYASHTACFEKIESSNVFQQLYYMRKFIRNSRKMVKEHLLTHSYEMIIDSSFFAFRFLAHKKEYVWVQHNSRKSRKGIIFNNPVMNFLSVLLTKSIGVFNAFKRIDNVVIYDKYNEADIKIKDKTFFKIPLPYMYDFKSSSFEDKKSVVFIGRLEKAQKRVDLLIKVAKYVNEPIIVYGTGPYVEKLKSAKNIIYKGTFNNEDVHNVFEKIKLTIILSNHEGFSFTAIESLSNSTPIIIRNTFPSAKFFTQTKNQGLLISELSSAKEIAKSINNYIKYIDSNRQEVFKDCLNFANTNFNISKFQDSWLQIYYELTDRDINLKTNSNKIFNS